MTDRIRYFSHKDHYYLYPWPDFIYIRDLIFLQIDRSDQDLNKIKLERSGNFM